MPIIERPVPENRKIRVAMGSRSLRHRRHNRDVENSENTQWNVDGDDTLAADQFQLDDTTFDEVDFCDGVLESVVQSEKESYGSMFDIKASYNRLYINGFDIASAAEKVDYRVYSKPGAFEFADGFRDWVLVTSDSILPEDGVAKIRWSESVMIPPAALQSFYVAFRTSSLMYGYPIMSMGEIYAANVNLELRLGAAVDWSGLLQEREVMWTGGIYYTAEGKCPTSASIISTTLRIKKTDKYPVSSATPSGISLPPFSPSSSPFPSISPLPSSAISIKATPSASLQSMLPSIPTSTKAFSFASDHMQWIQNGPTLSQSVSTAPSSEYNQSDSLSSEYNQSESLSSEYSQSESPSNGYSQLEQPSISANETVNAADIAGSVFKSQSPSLMKGPANEPSSSPSTTSQSLRFTKHPENAPSSRPSGYYQHLATISRNPKTQTGRPHGAPVVTAEPSGAPVVAMEPTEMPVVTVEPTAALSEQATPWISSDLEGGQLDLDSMATVDSPGIASSSSSAPSVTTVTIGPLDMSTKANELPSPSSNPTLTEIAFSQRPVDRPSARPSQVELAVLSSSPSVRGPQVLNSTTTGNTPAVTSDPTTTSEPSLGPTVTTTPNPAEIVSKQPMTSGAHRRRNPTHQPLFSDVPTITGQPSSTTVVGTDTPTGPISPLSDPIALGTTSESVPSSSLAPSLRSPQAQAEQAGASAAPASTDVPSMSPSSSLESIVPTQSESLNSTQAMSPMTTQVDPSFTTPSVTPSVDAPIVPDTTLNEPPLPPPSLATTGPMVLTPLTASTVPSLKYLSDEPSILPSLSIVEVVTGAGPATSTTTATSDSSRQSGSTTNSSDTQSGIYDSFSQTVSISPSVSTTTSISSSRGPTSETQSAPMMQPPIRGEVSTPSKASSISPATLLSVTESEAPKMSPPIKGKSQMPTRVPSQVPTTSLLSNSVYAPTAVFQSLLPSALSSDMTEIPTQTIVCSLAPNACNQPSNSLSPTTVQSSLLTRSFGSTSSFCKELTKDCPPQKSIPMKSAIPSSSMVESLEPTSTNVTTSDTLLGQEPSLSPTPTNEALLSLQSMIPSVTIVCSLMPSACEQQTDVPSLTSSPSGSYTPTLVTPLTTRPTFSSDRSIVPSATGEPSIASVLLPTLTTSETSSLSLEPSITTLPSTESTMTGLPTMTIFPSTLDSLASTIQPSITATPSLTYSPTQSPTVTGAPSSQAEGTRRPPSKQLHTIGNETHGQFPSIAPTRFPRNATIKFPTKVPSVNSSHIVGEFPTKPIQTERPHPSMVRSRSCPNFNMTEGFVETQVTFGYSVETTEFAAIFLESFEPQLLEKLAKLVLTCNSTRGSNHRLLEMDANIVRLAYPEQGSFITEISSCKATNPGAQSCWAIHSALLVFSDEASKTAVPEILLLTFRNIFEDSNFTSSAIPSSLVVTLMEDPSILVAMTQAPAGAIPSESSVSGGNQSSPLGLIIGLSVGGFVLLALMAIFLLCRKKEKPRKRPKTNYAGHDEDIPVLSSRSWNRTKSYHSKTGTFDELGDESELSHSRY